LCAGQTPHNDSVAREIEIAARLQHPHILTVLDSGEAGGRLWFTMPYVEGQTLRERLRREHQIPVEEAVRIAREAAGALDYAHDQGVVHGGRQSRRGRERVVTSLTASAKSRDEADQRLRIDTIYDEERASLKVIITGGIATTASLLKFVDVLLQQ